ncbi:MAG: hypothetical protein ACI82F_000426 [Planctomycetota bacterium]|jgi:hypothetical protein
MQGDCSAPESEIAAAARIEHDGLESALRAAGVRTLLIEDTPDPPKPDALFLNNWVSFHGDGTVILYPMQAPIRQAEVRRDLVDELRAQHGVRIERVIDLTPLAEHGAFLEGTGSLVLDRRRGLAFACRSPRTTPQGLAAFAEATGYRVQAFDSLDASGQPFYHTNVMLCVGDAVALACFDSLPNDDERSALRAALDVPGRIVIDLSRGQVSSFLGNALEVAQADGSPALVMSSRARAALSADQSAALARALPLIVTPFPTIEQVGGGGVRCALAAMHCPMESELAE